MEYEILYSSYAEEDISHALEYYQNRVSKKTASSFFNDLLLNEQKLKNTVHFQKVYKDFHHLPFKKFPYSFIYKIDSNTKTIWIYRVFHTSQNPEKYQK